MEELDPDFSMEMPTNNNHTNNSFGNDFSNQQESNDFLNDSFSSSSFNSFNSISSDQYSGESSSINVLGDQEDLNGTPIRIARLNNGNNSIKNSNRLSLANELQNIGSSNRSSTRDILSELGIDEDEEGNEKEDYDSEEDEFEQEQQANARNGVSNHERELGRNQDEEDHLTANQIDRNKLSPFRSVSSTSSTPSSTSFHPFESSSPSSHSSLSNCKDDSDIIFPLTTTALESDLGSTTSFLNHLRQHTNPNSIKPLSSTTFAINEPPIDFTDRQPLVENLATSLVDSLHELVKLREEQVKELVEMEKLVNKNDSSWQKILATLDEFDDDNSNVSNLVVDDHVSRNFVEEEQENLEHDDPLTPTTSRFYRSSSSSNPNLDSSPVQSELFNLRQVTSTLISALSTLNEAAQVNSSQSSDISRKLKSLKAHLTTIKEELTSFHKAEAYISIYEKEEMEIPSEIRKGRYSTAARECLKDIEGELEQGWIKCKSIFTEVV